MNPADFDRARVAAFRKLLRGPLPDAWSGYARTVVVVRGGKVLARGMWTEAPR